MPAINNQVFMTLLSPLYAPELKRRGCTLKIEDQRGERSQIAVTCIKVDKLFIYS